MPIIIMTVVWLLLLGSQFYYFPIGFRFSLLSYKNKGKDPFLAGKKRKRIERRLTNKVLSLHQGQSSGDSTGL